MDLKKCASGAEKLVPFISCVDLTIVINTVLALIGIEIKYKILNLALFAYFLSSNKSEIKHEKLC